METFTSSVAFDKAPWTAFEVCEIDAMLFSQIGCKIRLKYKQSPLWAADHSGSATGTAWEENKSLREFHKLWLYLGLILRTYS